MSLKGVSVLDYVRWNGKKDFSENAINEVDGLVFSQMIYLPLEEVVPGWQVEEAITLHDAARHFFEVFDEEKSSLGILLPHEIFDLFRLMSESKRYKNLWLMKYCSENNSEQELQFGAITIVIPQIHELFVVFRGTDDTLNGWKEDLNMGYLPMVPSQKMAIRYLETIVQSTVGTTFRVRVGGHSKGGNLASFAGSADAKKEYQYKILAIYNYDGPGLPETVVQSEQWKIACNKYHKYVPTFAIIGMFLETETDYQVVCSSQVGLLQHDALSWRVLGSHFVLEEEISKEAMAMNQSFKQWLSGMDEQETRHFVKAMYELLGATKATSLTDLLAGGLKNIGIILQTYAKEDKATKKCMHIAMKNFVKTSLTKRAKLHIFR